MELRLLDVSDEFDFDDVPGYVFDIVVDEMERTVGRIEYRFEEGRELLYYGHVGYVIYLPYRGHGFAEKACRQLAIIIKSYHPEIMSMMITCNPDNLPSKATIENLGAVYLQRVQIDEDHELYDQGDYEKEVYEWIL
ncbi:MAG TPA: GNAT family N-acetyltransferase [Erysipelothrix sp.]|nr:GNAT family N-acetyltransferase [Erysipelothrix sp.]